jgi:hypothetical protein
VAALGVACAIEAGQHERAVALFENGRGILNTGLQHGHTGLDRLRHVAPELAQRLLAIRAGLDRPPAAGGVGGLTVPVTTSVARAATLSASWKAALAEVRALPGFADFLRFDTITAQQRTLLRGPVVLLNIASWRSDALVVGPTIDHVPLPGMTARRVADRLKAYVPALFRAQADESQVRRELITGNMLEWLWDDVVEPVLIALGHRRAIQSEEPWPIVWWCPGGPLALVPLHAAGYYDDDAPAGRNAMDRVVSAYTPTLRALLQPKPPTTPDGRMLVVAMRETRGKRELPGVGRELVELNRLFAAGRRTVLAEAGASRHAVLTELRRHPWVHFSCHGDQDLDDPLASGLFLHDGMLTIDELTGQWTPGEFAFLSACMTAFSADMPDESLTFAGALRAAGWQRVVATLWYVDDDAAADVTGRFYRQLTRTGTFDLDNAAIALHLALREFRDTGRRKDLHRPSDWSPFVYFGP